MLKVIENLGRVHRKKLYRARVARAPSPAAFDLALGCRPRRGWRSFDNRRDGATLQNSKSTSIASISGISQLTSF
jgi:hypothetical protein